MRAAVRVSVFGAIGAAVVAAIIVLWAGGSEPAPVLRTAPKVCPAMAAPPLARRIHQLDRFYTLSDAARQELRAGHLDEAHALATEVLELAPRFVGDWNHGNAIHHGHTVHGLIALAHGDVAEARRQLLASGNTDGSPQLNSFGPSMELASALLERGERATVLVYLDECRRFWEMGPEKLDAWSADIAAGREPDFGFNRCL